MNSSTKYLRIFNRSKVANFLEGTLSSDIDVENVTLIIGFWRSGTTYLLESLQKSTNSRICFEPFQDLALKENKLNYQGFEFNFEGERINQFYPIVKANAEDSMYDDFFDDLVHGHISSAYTRRTQPLRALNSNKLIVKMIRASLVAAYLQKRCHLKTIFIVRNPAGVISSIVREKGGTKAIKTCLTNDRFMNYLIDSINKESNYLDGKMDVVEKYRVNDVGKITLLWCILNYIPLKQIESDLFNPQVIKYEDLSTNPIDVLSKLTGVSLDPTKIDFNSSTTKKERKRSNKVRINSWETELSHDQIELIFNIVNDFEDELFLPFINS
ncbi:sulfotransferase domain-containing protein [Ekhidna sp. To15]|uniref:sulfotransferase domain-containing protein n=1 Tax=Ekhidna sp. To15 TaxID=3395267 RepID=UPI003F525CC3